MFILSIRVYIANQSVTSSQRRCAPSRAPEPRHDNSNNNNNDNDNNNMNTNYNNNNNTANNNTITTDNNALSKLWNDCFSREPSRSASARSRAGPISGCARRTSAAQQ